MTVQLSLSKGLTHARSAKMAHIWPESGCFGVVRVPYLSVCGASARLVQLRQRPPQGLRFLSASFSLHWTQLDSRGAGGSPMGTRVCVSV